MSQTAEDESVSLVGDYFMFATKLSGFAESQVAGAPTVTAPPGACFRVIEEVEKPDPNDPAKKVRYVRGAFVPRGADAWWRIVLPPYLCADTTSLRASLDPTTRYDIQRDSIVNGDRTRYGFTYGILVAPFKYYTATREFSAGATVGPYLGYRFDDRPGSSAVAALAIGAAAANVKKEDGSSSISNGLSFAAAYLVEIKKDFNVSFLLGTDMFSDADKVPNSGRPWIGISFGKKIN